MIYPEVSSLMIPAFIAGIITFLAPCTLPLIPAYLGFISGTSAAEFNDPARQGAARAKIFLNGLFFMLGVTFVFVVFGTLAGILGQSLAPWRIWLTRLGGAFVIIFGLYMIGLLKIGPLNSLFGVERKVKLPFALRRGSAFSSSILGASFAFGWTPCVGPILGSILLLASTSATALQGGILLFVFSMGLAVPFLIIAAGFGTISTKISKIAQYLKWVEITGGVFLIALGILLTTGRFGLLISWGYQLFNFINYDALLDYL